MTSTMHARASAALLPKIRRKMAITLGAAALGTVALISLIAQGQETSLVIPPTILSADPLYAATTVDKPAMALALSVEYPTVGAQYRDATYTPTNEYLGYYDAESCYTYVDSPTETPATGKSIADYKRFDRSGAATNRQCTDAFSGNFLNWASSSSIDMLRLALSGGDRYIDESNLTILQRAVLPNGDPVCFWNNSTNFPAKQLEKDGGGTGAYWGAIPQALKTAANNNPIWIANTLNRIYFKAGETYSGSCTNTVDYFLGGARSMESPIRSGTALPSSGMTLCINGETGVCSFTGVKEVWYGANSKWYVAAAYNGVDCSSGCNTVFGDPIKGIAKKVYYRSYTGSWTPPSSSALNSDGFFYSRVQVCNASGTTLQDVRDYGLCTQYPNGNYKPTGVIQKYADQIRLAAFGYLMDQTASYNDGRYGGVLRAPMKYVGQKNFDIYGRDNGSNSKSEWDNNTGIFKTNPENDSTFGISGVINYLNQFGRTGPTAGVYKKYDPVGELYYQSLRYLQGLPPTNDAIKDLGTLDVSNAFYDGYPVYTDWTDLDPYGGGRSATENYACLKSNIVVIGDIHTHDGDWRNTTVNTADNVPNFKNSYDKLRAYETLHGNNSSPSNSRTSQIMGYAYWAHTNDIRGTDWTNAPAKQRPGLRVKTFIFDVNEYGNSTDLATRSKSNQFFMAAKYGGFENDPNNPGGNPYNDLSGTPDPHKDNDGNADNRIWQRTDGDASTYYLQSNARGVLTAFDNIFSRASTAARSIASSASQSSNQNASSANYLYTAQFNTSAWTGDVIAEAITTDTDGNISVSTTPSWSAAARLKLKQHASRNIYVGHGSATAATAFTWDAISGKTLQDHLNKALPSATADGQGQIRLNYLRGDRSEEGQDGRFRTRTELLGDIINSGVTYSGAPTVAYSGSGYAKFRAANDSRVPAVFAGANDGMLHAFAAQSDSSKGVTAGDELFAYIPSWLGPNLSALTSKDYINNHQAYVDAPSTVGEVQVANADAATDWKTVLVSGTGAGGRGVFALDVSKPESFGAANAIWEFTPSDDADIGYVVGRPQLLKFKTGTNTYRWFAAVASGANNYNSSYTSLGGSGQPAIFLLALDKAVGTPWTLGTNYFKISFPIDSTLAATLATGMANFSALWGPAGEVTQIYAGDFHGRVWKLDFTKICTSTDTSCYGYKPTSDWNLNKLSSFNKGTTASPQPYPFFIAKDASGNVQPITAAPSLFTGPIVAGVETFYVMIGTGKYLETGDNLSTRTQSVYALYDNGSTSADSSPITAAISGRGRLQQATVNTTTNQITTSAFTWGRPSSDSNTAQRAGWYFDLPSTGEKVVTSIINQGGLTATFNTLIPNMSGASSATCATNEGSGKQYTIKVGTATGDYVNSTVGVLGESLFLVNEDKTEVTAYDSTGRAVRKINKQSIQIGSQGVSTGKSITIDEVVGRLSWRQIYNYQELKNE
ncbi:MAG: PilC/PilY family type IV pilus protein [Acidovorax sp.]|uniref:pilus assembly protein n=1 Tax=Acidovorax sp. TaxID=1872122 RepID=UPI0039E69838